MIDAAKKLNIRQKLPPLPVYWGSEVGKVYTKRREN